LDCGSLLPLSAMVACCHGFPKITPHLHKRFHHTENWQWSSPTPDLPTPQTPKHCTISIETPSEPSHGAPHSGEHNVTEPDNCVGESTKSPENFATILSAPADGPCDSTPLSSGYEASESRVSEIGRSLPSMGCEPPNDSDSRRWPKPPVSSHILPPTLSISPETNPSSSLQPEEASDTESEQ